MWIVYYTDITNQLTTRLTLISIASARKAMPGVKTLMIYPTWHLVDPNILRAVDYFKDIPYLERNVHYDYRRCLANADVVGEALFVDTDIVFQDDIRNIFKYPFDIAPTLREAEIDPAIPYNMGVCFSRTPSFWKHVAFNIPKNSPNYWKDSELAFSRCAASSEYTKRDLQGRLYNRSPNSKTDDVSNAYIVHYKGPHRKAWMLAREKEFIS